MLARELLYAGQHRISSVSVSSLAEDGLLEGRAQHVLSAHAAVDGSDQKLWP
jgi:hypothetical protein